MYSSDKDSKQTNPLQNLFADIKKILEFIELKDEKEASDNETSESLLMSEMWMNAIVEDDSYLTYTKWWKYSMFQEAVPNTRIIDIKKWMDNPFSVPLKYRDTLLLRGREAFINEYEEQNDYYRMLNGLPPLSTRPEDYIYLSEPVRNQLHASNDPVHKLSKLIQNNYMSTDEYKEVVKNNPDKKYLKYLGMYKIDIYTARKAKDFDIIRYPYNRSNINPNLLNVFASLYADYREYVMVALYNKQFEDLYYNYRTFMGVLIMSFTLLQISNKSLEAVHSKKFLDDTVLHILLSMYGIPDDLLMANDVRRDLALNVLKLIREKATDDVYYDLIRILGYQEVIVSKLMLLKGQQFNQTDNYKALESSDPYFVKIDLKDKDPYETITKGKAPIYSYHEIIDNDPRWWDLDDVQQILHESSYTITDTKYIVVEAVVHQMKYMFEAIYFSRLVLDNKYATDEFLVEIPSIFGTKMMSLYDLIIFIICATCMSNGLKGDIITDTDKLLATAGFNFDMDLDSFMEFLNTTKYVDKSRLMKFMDNLTMTSPEDVNRLFNNVMYPLREWLENKIEFAENRQEYIEYESIYKALFTYDIARNQFLDDFEMPMQTIQRIYGISNNDLKAFKNFYPHTVNGKSVKYEEYNATINNSRYKYPFLSTITPVNWYMHITIQTRYGEEDRGYIYFYDILNSPNALELTNPDGTRVFMDYEDGEVGWEVNQLAVNRALELIDSLDEDALKTAYFQISTPVKGDKTYPEGQKLPVSIRSGLYKTILKEKLRMDLEGLAKPPVTYFEYLRRKNPDLYELLTHKNRFLYDKEAWMNDVISIVLAIESELNVHMKYFEQSVLGEELFFKPLITLIKRFKSELVDFAKTGLKYIFADKMDSGGNSNMFKLFDNMRFTIHFVNLGSKGYDAQFGLYDTEHKVKHRIIMKDRSEILRMVIGEGFAAEVRETTMGSIRLVDEVKFFKNGKPIDSDDQHSHWIPGESGIGRWSEEDDYLMKIRRGNARITNAPVDLDGWKDFVPSYNSDDE